MVSFGSQKPASCHASKGTDSYESLGLPDLSSVVGAASQERVLCVGGRCSVWEGIGGVDLKQWE